MWNLCSPKPPENDPRFTVPRMQHTWFSYQNSQLWCLQNGQVRCWKGYCKAQKGITYIFRDLKDFDVFGSRPLMDAQLSKACMNPIQ
jgi:hypothetical protein